jgi:hypothetical protein
MQADEAQWAGHKICKKWNYFFPVSFIAPAVFFSAPSLSFLKTFRNQIGANQNEARF